MNNFQHCGFISLLYSIGDKPLALWSKHVSSDGKIRRIRDEVLHGDKVIEIVGLLNVATPTSITCPAKCVDVLDIKLPVLVLVIRNLDQKFKLEFQLLDKDRHRRKFSLISYNHEKLPDIGPSVARIPLTLAEYWNTLEINLQNLCNDVYGTNYEALQRITIYPNCCLRRVYLQDRHYDHDETPIGMCQAFFDMYMLKWGIHLIERASQTEEQYIGPLQPCDVEYITTESHVSVNLLASNVNLARNISNAEVKDNTCLATNTIQECRAIALKNSYRSLISLCGLVEQSSPDVTNVQDRSPIQCTSLKLIKYQRSFVPVKATKSKATDMHPLIQETKDVSCVHNSEELNTIPPFVETEARTLNVKSRSTFLSTDKAISNFLHVRYTMNKKILEKLQGKGLTMPEVELSIYNSRNRRNCYGQGRLIRSQEQCVDKASGYRSITPVNADLSLRKELLKLDNDTCTSLRNELNPKMR